MPKDKQRGETRPAPAPADEAGRLSQREDAYLKASKEIVVKFIETGRLSAANFQETFALIYRGIKETMEEGR
ncbi:MAG: hypothetical protein ACOZHQ_17185 [Thermodesulfobacteriota bacterium]